MRATTTELQMTVPAATSELGGLRGQVRARAIELGADPASADEFVLVVSELATNVLMHTDDEKVSVSLGFDGGSWVIEVAGADGLVDVNPVRAPGPDSLGGRGLLIVNAMMDDVSLVDTGSGRLVRCRKHVAE